LLHGLFLVFQLGRHVGRRDSGLQSELQLGLGGARKGLEDLWVALVKGDVSAGGIGEALEEDVLLGLDVEDLTKLMEMKCQYDILI
jgi:hypothetical protein